MNELSIYCSGNDYKRHIIKYEFRWFRQGIAGGCLNQGCVVRRKAGTTFLGSFGYSTYTYYLVKDFSRLSIYEPIFCIFSPSEINYCLSEINRVLNKKIKWKLESKKICDIDTYILTVKVPNCYSNLQHLYILTRIRCLYEAPFCLFMMDALKLQKELKFSGGIEEAYIEVLNHSPSTGSCIFLGSWGYSPFNPVRCVVRSKDIIFPGLEVIKKRLLKYDCRSIHEIYGDVCNENSNQIKIENGELFDLDWWLNGYEKYRRPYYLNLNTRQIPKYIKQSYSYIDSNCHKDKIYEWKKEIFDV